MILQLLDLVQSICRSADPQLKDIGLNTYLCMSK